MKITMPEVGKAYMGGDGIVRWCVAISSRRYYHFLWRDEKDWSVWHDGGKYRHTSFADGYLMQGGEVSPPQPGEKYYLIGIMGRPIEMTARDFR